MSSRHNTRILLILVAFLLVLAACRRGQPEAVPTLASPAEIEPTEAAAPAEPTEEPAAEAEPTAAPIVARPVPVEDIDWPPQVVASDPLPGQEVGLETPITVRFDQPMDQSSLEAAFTLDPPMAGDVSWREPDTSVFTPPAPLELW